MADKTKQAIATDEGRRSFLKAISAAGLAVSAGGSAMLLRGEEMIMQTANGVLAVDLKKCMGCGTCMTSCSLAHNGVSSVSLSRIQIQQDHFVPFPDDISMSTCLQCDDAPCVRACPVGANAPDGDFGWVRDINPDKCIGCMQCIEACPFTPKRIQWNPAERIAQKCDLCANTPFLDAAGGPNGVRTCESICPVRAIKFIPQQPKANQNPDEYVINLRTENWQKLGRTLED